jgi:hypothetical protein
LQHSPRGRFAKLLEPLLTIVVVGSLQLNIKWVSEKNFLGFVLRDFVSRDVSQIGFIPIEKQRLTVHKCFQIPELTKCFSL